MRIKSKSQDELEREDIKRMLDNVSFPCPRMDLLHGILLQFQRAWLIAPSMTPPPHVNQRCTMTPMENKMSEIKTVTHEGQVYQIGKDYLFSMSQLHWTYASLTDIDGGYDKVFCTSQEEWLYIKEVPASENMGTITPAPIELIDGNAYMFDYDNQGNISGVYDSESERFYFTKGRHVSVSNCMLIRPMTVAESK